MVVFDVCGTLFRCNTTFEFVRYYFPCRAAIIFSCPLRILGRLTRAVFGYDLIRRLAVSSFKGLTPKQVSIISERFYDDILAHRKIDKVFDLLQEHKADAVLVSASLEPLIEVIAARLEVESYLASELEVVDERYTGRLSRDLLGNKSQFVSGQPIALVVTDNKSDIDIVELSERAVIVADANTFSFWTKHKRCQDEIIKV